MKIVCDACQAKYSISDDKVQGKVFKIRCKKCSNIIVVRGGAGAAEPAAAPQQEKDTRVYDYGYEGGDQAPSGDESVWHVVINQDQVGPMTAQDVQQRFASGEIDAETYIWREGFGDWMPLAQVDAFAALAASGQTTTATGHGGAAAVSAMFGGGADEAGTVRSDPGDLFAAASAGRAHQDDDGGDLFGSKPARGQQPSAANSKLRGERNENSVLFSLNNLAQLASDKPAPVTAAPSSSGAATGVAGGEGSGLIDIRSMASAYLGSTGAAKPASAGIGSIDDLPVFGGGGFSEPAVIVPMAARSSNNRLMYALIGSVALLAVAAVVVVVVLLKNDKPTQVAAAGASGATGSDMASGDKVVTPDKPTTPEKQPDQANGSGSNTQVASQGLGDKQPTTPDKQPTTPDKTPPPDKHTSPPPVHKATPNPGISANHNPPPTHDKTVAPPKDNTVIKDKGGGGDSSGCDEVSCVLNNYEGACCSKFKKGGGGGSKSPPASGGGDKPPVHSDLPDSLDRTMISDGVSKVKAKVMSCGDKSPAKGQVKVSVKVSADGHVSSVSVKNTPDPGLGSCVAGAMQHASFSKTQNGGSFSYPFVF